MPQDESTELDGSISLETFMIRVAVRDVGRSAARRESREDILARYPDLRDEDIELAKTLVMTAASNDESLDEVLDIDSSRFRRLRGDDERLEISDFDRWVSDNNISETFEYAKGWRDYVELVRRPVRRARGCSPTSGRRPVARLPVWCVSPEPGAVLVPRARRVGRRDPSAA